MSARGKAVGGLGPEPTAVHEVAETQDTPLRRSPPVPLLGLAEIVQALPFQDSTRVWSWPFAFT